MGNPADNFKRSKRHRCPRCQHNGVSVIDKRNHYGDTPKADHSMRRRLCQKCGYRWSTVELHKSHYDVFVKLMKLSKKREEKARAKVQTKQQQDKERLVEAIRRIEGRNK